MSILDDLQTWREETLEHWRRTSRHGGTTSHTERCGTKGEPMLKIGDRVLANLNGTGPPSPGVVTGTIHADELDPKEQYMIRFDDDHGPCFYIVAEPDNLQPDTLHHWRDQSAIRHTL